MAARAAQVPGIHGLGDGAPKHQFWGGGRTAGFPFVSGGVHEERCKSQQEKEKKKKETHGQWLITSLSDQLITRFEGISRDLTKLAPAASTTPVYGELVKRAGPKSHRFSENVKRDIREICVCRFLFSALIHNARDFNTPSSPVLLVSSCLNSLLRPCTTVQPETKKRQTLCRVDCALVYAAPI